MTAKKDAPLEVIRNSIPLPSKKGKRKISHEHRAAAIIRRYFLLATVRTLLPDERVNGCMRIIVDGGHWVFIERDRVNKRARFKNIGRCSSIWVCPVCASVIAERRRDELTRLTIAAREMGYALFMATYTVRHNESQTLYTVMQQLKGAHIKLKQNRAGMDYRAKFQIVGSVRGFEVTHGENGWHPHIHEIIVTKMPADRDTMKVELEQYLRNRWVQLVRERGGDVEFDIGVNVQSEHEKLAEYIAKYGREPEDHTWGFEHELTKSNSKVSDRTGRTPFQLVQDYITKGDKQAAALFIEFAIAFKGEQQLRWSTKFKDHLGVQVRSDEDANIEPGKMDIVAAIAKDFWRLCWKRELQGELINIAASGDLERLKRFIWQVGVDSGELHHFTKIEHVGEFAPNDVEEFKADDFHPF